MNDETYSKKLAEKLCEEAAEFRESGSNEELADILEVFYAILKNKGIEIGEIEEIRKEKALTNGAFDKKYLLKGVIS